MDGTKLMKKRKINNATIYPVPKPETISQTGIPVELQITGPDGKGLTGKFRITMASVVSVDTQEFECIDGVICIYDLLLRARTGLTFDYDRAFRSSD